MREKDKLIKEGNGGSKSKEGRKERERKRKKIWQTYQKNVEINAKIKEKITKK